MVKQVLEGHTALGRTKRTRVSIIGFCLLLCGVSFIDLEAKPEYKPVNESLDRILLRSEGPIQILREVSVPRDRLYAIRPYEDWFENKHLWIHVQGVAINDIPTGILYVEFRNEEDAEAGLRRRLAQESSGLILEGRRFGRFAVFTTRPACSPEKSIETIFSALEERFNSTPDAATTSPEADSAPH